MVQQRRRSPRCTSGEKQEPEDPRDLIPRLRECLQPRLEGSVVDERVERVLQVGGGPRTWGEGGEEGERVELGVRVDDEGALLTSFLSKVD